MITEDPEILLYVVVNINPFIFVLSNSGLSEIAVIVNVSPFISKNVFDKFIWVLFVPKLMINGFTIFDTTGGCWNGIKNVFENLYRPSSVVIRTECPSKFVLSVNTVFVFSLSPSV